VNLSLFGNALTGTIPIEVRSNIRVAFLRALWPRTNTKQITISSLFQIGGMLALEHLWVNTNALTGQLPTTIGLVTNLIEIVAYENDMSGTLPAVSQG
jgi:hypothetical protein